jgi:formyltetrahydrofolate deformylase
VVRLDHRHSVKALTPLGADVERGPAVAVSWHSQNRIIRHGNQTITF